MSSLIPIGEPTRKQVGKKKRYWKKFQRYRCECGNEFEACSDNVRSGNTTSCGCFHKKQLSDMARRHGMSKTIVYRKWLGMKSRIFNKKNSHYDRYGGRGISICERWMVFENFAADMGPMPSKKHEIDRKNNDGNYEPSNCRWATRKEQTRNYSRNRLMTIDGVTRVLAEWSEISGIPSCNIISRIDTHGWPEKMAVFEPVRKGGGKKRWIRQPH